MQDDVQLMMQESLGIVDETDLPTVVRALLNTTNASNEGPCPFSFISYRAENATANVGAVRIKIGSVSAGTLMMVAEVIAAAVKSNHAVGISPHTACSTLSD